LALAKVQPCFKLVLSVVILTKNSVVRIGKCLDSVRFADEIIVIDDYSTDKTVKIAKKRGAKVFKRRLKGDFSAQRNFGLKKAKGDWVLFVDSDERISAALAAEIQPPATSHQPPVFSGFFIKRKDKFLGKWLKHGETASVRLLRLAKKGSGKWEGRVHEVWKIKGKIGKLKNPILHDHTISVSSFIKRLDCYSTLRTKELFKKGIKEGFWKVFVYPLAKFFLNYFWRFGFLDGYPGLVMALLMSYHSLLVRTKLRALWKKKYL